MASDQTPQLMVDLLRLLAKHWWQLRTAVEDQHARDVEVKEAHQELVDSHPFEHLLVRVEEITGMDRDDLREAVLRLNTSMGLRPYKKRGPPADYVKKIEVDAESFPDPPAAIQYRDLSWILPKLRELDGDGTTLLLRREIWSQFPTSFLSNIGLSRPEEDKPEPKHRFLRDGGIWQIRFGEEHSSFPATQKGFGIIAKLLESPNPQKPISALELAGANPDLDKASQSPQPTLDGEAKASYREQIDGCDRDIEEAERSRDHPKADSLKKEKQEVIEQLKAHTGLHGKSKELGPRSASGRARDAVQKAIKRAITHITNGPPPMKSLAAHLRNHIRPEGDAFAYRPPDPAPGWVF